MYLRGYWMSIARRFHLAACETDNLTSSKLACRRGIDKRRLNIRGSGSQNQNRERSDRLPHPPSRHRRFILILTVTTQLPGKRVATAHKYGNGSDSDRMPDPPGAVTLSAL